jgi:hypothetical protein
MGFSDPTNKPWTQEKIIELKKKNNLKYLVVFGASEGFHALGLMKNKFFNKAYIFEKDNRTRNLLIKNSLINKIKNINIFSEANFYCIANFLKKNATNKIFEIWIICLKTTSSHYTMPFPSYHFPTNLPSNQTIKSTS